MRRKTDSGAKRIFNLSLPRKIFKLDKNVQ